MQEEKNEKSIFKSYTLSKLEGHKRKITNIGFSSDGKLASCSLDLTTRIWDINVSNTPYKIF
jgi:WD40 repeat protein